MAAQDEVYDEGYEDEVPLEGTEMAEDHDFNAMQTAEELEAMKKKLKEMEEEAARLRGLQGAAAADGAASGSADVSNKEEADTRSIYVGNVDYSVTPEELQQHFQSCGTVNRVTILTDRFGQPKGYAYIEFLEVDAVGNAVLLDNTELHGRQIKVMQKRTNVPGLKAARGRGRGRGGFPGGRGGYPPYGAPYGGRGGRGFYPPPYAYGYGYGYAPRGRGRGRGFFSPY